MKYYTCFADAIKAVGENLRRNSKLVHPDKWQGIDVAKRPEAAMHEVLHTSFAVMTGGNEDLQNLRADIGPNMPWADDHFRERVEGFPSNPGDTWRSWPWANAADKHRTEGEKFTHTYMERYWPKYNAEGVKRYGIMYEYGDLNNVVEHLAKHPESRQAFLPVWFPEDTGVTHEGRVPCTLGYHWIRRDDLLHTTYYIRSCDFYRHFRDDLYLSQRLTIWMLDRLREESLNWSFVRPGLFVFHCVSMHLFVNDFRSLFNGKQK